jgi:hypothetical protein
VPVKLDLKKEHRALFRATRTPNLIEVPSISYVSIDGSGAPSANAFQEALATLFAVAYTLKFDLKKRGRLDWVVAPLEALWWNEPDLTFQTGADPAAMRWKAMIAQPDEVDAEDVRRACEAARAKGSPAVDLVKLERYEEGTAAQVLHVGPYSAEIPTLELLHVFIKAHGYRPHLAHHEIYLGDPRRTAPERLRTILRQPVTR